MLTLKDCAARLMVSIPTILRIIAKGDLRAFRAGRAWRIEERDLTDYIERQKRGALEPRLIRID